LEIGERAIENLKGRESLIMGTDDGARWRAERCVGKYRFISGHGRGVLVAEDVPVIAAVCPFAGGDMEPTGVDVPPILKEFMATAGWNDVVSPTSGIEGVIEVGDVWLPLLIGKRPSPYCKRFDASVSDRVHAVNGISLT
jgi:hypothetical protein